MMWLVLGLTVGAIAGWFTRGFRSPDGQRVGVDVPASIEPAPSAPSAPAARPQTSAERDKLVDACVWAYESSPSRAVQRRMRHALRDVGVTLLEPADGPFDPAYHEWVGGEEASAAAASGTVARTLRAGVLDGERLVRPAQVVVYTDAKARPDHRGAP
jgi:molecular chaperone GrpE